MRIQLKTKHYLGLTLGFLILIIDFVLFFNFTGKIGPKVWYFNPIIVIALLIGSLSLILDFLNETKRQKEIETEFLEFIRGLVENVRSGVSIPQAILHVSNTDYGALSPYVHKLANQIEWGYPLKTALQIFAKDTGNEVIKRATAIVIEAEKSGGDIGSVLEAVAGSVVEIKKVKEERKTNASSQTIQGYIIYIVFIGVMVMLQVFLIPKISALTIDVSVGLASGGVNTASIASEVDFGRVFIALIVVQGLFAGLMIGKFAEGDYKEGIKHSIIMVLGGYLITATLTGIFQPETVAPLVLLIKKDWILKRKKEE